jgi:hypothetical protein
MPTDKDVAKLRRNLAKFLRDQHTWARKVTQNLRRLNRLNGISGPTVTNPPRPPRP